MAKEIGRKREEEEEGRTKEEEGVEGGERHRKGRCIRETEDIGRGRAQEEGGT